MANMQINFVLPPKEAGKVCPYLPPIPVPKQIEGSGMDLHFTPCIGLSCAVYDSCQGDSSPMMRGMKDRNRLALLASVARSLKDFPFISGTMKEKLEEVAAKLDLQAMPSPKPTPDAAGSPETPA